MASDMINFFLVMGLLKKTLPGYHSRQSGVVLTVEFNSNAISKACFPVVLNVCEI